MLYERLSKIILVIKPKSTHHFHQNLSTLLLLHDVVCEEINKIYVKYLLMQNIYLICFIFLSTSVLKTNRISIIKYHIFSIIVSKHNVCLFMDYLFIWVAKSYIWHQFIGKGNTRQFRHKYNLLGWPQTFIFWSICNFRKVKNKTSKVHKLIIYF